MTRVRMVARISGLTIDLPDAEAADLIHARLAIPADLPRPGRGRRRADLPPARPRLPHIPVIARAQRIDS